METDIKYEGYLALEQEKIARFASLEKIVIPEDTDYSSIRGLRKEAGQKLAAMRPDNVGRASRISGVSPADCEVLLVWLEQQRRKRMSDSNKPERKPITKDDIARLRMTLPKVMDLRKEEPDRSDDAEDDAMGIVPILEDSCTKIEVPLSAEEIRAFQIYASMLRAKNKVLNLTTIVDDEGIAMRHFIDSLTLCSYIREEEQHQSGKTLKLADVGTGAGFPGLPIKISMPEVSVTLMDSLAKRLNFLQEVVDELALEVCRWFTAELKTAAVTGNIAKSMT